VFVVPEDFVGGAGVAGGKGVDAAEQIVDVDAGDLVAATVLKALPTFLKRDEDGAGERFAGFIG
jgi:hypothetical protein